MNDGANTGQADRDESWSGLARLSESAREAEMVTRCRDLAAMPDGERAARLEAMARAEYALDEDALRPFTASRLRAWLTLNRENPEAASRVARDWDELFDRLPGAIAMRRASIVQTVAREDLTSDEVEELFALIPSIVRSVPRAATSAVQQLQRGTENGRRGGGGASAAAGAATGGDEARTGASRPRWKFWSR